MLKEHTHFLYVKGINGRLWGQPFRSGVGYACVSCSWAGLGCHLELQHPAPALVLAMFTACSLQVWSLLQSKITVFKRCKLAIS